MVSKIGLEALLQRGRSPLFNEMVDLFTEVDNHLQEARKRLKGRLTIGTVISTTKTLRLSDKLKKLVEKYTHIPVDKVAISNDQAPNLMATLDPTKSLAEKVKKSKINYQTAMAALERYYDDRNATLDMTKVTDVPYKFGLVIHGGMWLPINDDGTSFFTPQELAATFLHEVGHLDHFIRGMVKTNHTLMDASDIVDYVKSSRDKAFLKLLVDKLAKVRIPSEISKNMIEQLKAKLASDDIDNVELDEISDFVGFLSIYLEASNAIPYLSHVVPSNLHGIDAERSADEFSVRNGAYADLVSALRKLQSVGEGQNFTRVMKYSLGFAPAAILSYFAKFNALFNVAAEDISHGYDPIIRRLSLIVETAKHAFADPTLSEEASADIKHQIEAAEKCIADYKSQTHVRTRQAIKSWLTNMGKFGRILKSPIDYRIHRDYERLQDANRSLSRNPFYYMAKN